MSDSKNQNPKPQIMATTTSTKTEPVAKTPIPYRQIRALYDDETITVYQAYSAPIALAAVTHQKLNASPDFKMQRMTWIKPSWCWMMYRSGYSFKDANQAHILALKRRHEDFERLLREAVCVFPVRFLLSNCVGGCDIFRGARSLKGSGHIKVTRMSNANFYIFFHFRQSAATTPLLPPNDEKT